ncbi:hypothetical protein [Pedobacter endophyticus]|uniref:Uncharacterized protein n=1 Tax=Pedobacter endophyticus TaxID=2789740 RepID=A0A7U3Q4N8_9SPHI|nr:hypothetical protein [Pedobacter endophyticus]QPH38530.1 hypothetical protein IZT61_15760 [Pedobacter endophyticus]
MRKILFMIALSLISAVALAQDTIGRDLRKLAHLKLWCELYGIYPNQKIFSNHEKNKAIRDSLFYQYVSLIAKVKKSPEVYLTYINRVLKENTDSLRKQTTTYNNSIVTMLNRYNPHSIKIIDLYRVIKYSLFERDDDYLPEDFRGLGVIDPKNYHGYYEPEPKRKAAIKYIIKRFSLNAKEKKFLRDELNVGYVMDIKTFLDTCAQTTENEMFIRKSIAGFVKDKGAPLIGLYYDHLLFRDTENYIPRDKEPPK